MDTNEVEQTEVETVENVEGKKRLVPRLGGIGLLLGILSIGVGFSYGPGWLFLLGFFMFFGGTIVLAFSMKENSQIGCSFGPLIMVVGGVVFYYTGLAQGSPVGLQLGGFIILIGLAILAYGIYLFQRGS